MLAHRLTQGAPHGGVERHRHAGGSSHAHAGGPSHAHGGPSHAHGVHHRSTRHKPKKPSADQCREHCGSDASCDRIDLLQAHEHIFQCAVLLRTAKVLKHKKQVMREDAPPALILELERGPATADGYHRLQARAKVLRGMIRAKARSSHSNALRAAMFNQQALAHVVSQFERLKTEATHEPDKRSKKKKVHLYKRVLKALRELLVKPASATRAAHGTSPHHRRASRGDEHAPAHVA